MVAACINVVNVLIQLTDLITLPAIGKIDFGRDLKG